MEESGGSHGDGKKNGFPVLRRLRVSRGGGWRSSAAIGRLRPSPKSTSSLWLAKNSGVAHANHLTPAPPPPRPPPNAPNSVQLCTYCIGAAKLCLLIYFFFFLTVG